MTISGSRPFINVCERSGIHPWVLETRFEVAKGKLQGTRTIVGQLRAPITDGLDEVLPIEYRVETSALSRAESLSAYRIGVPHITGPQEQLLVTKIAQVNNTPMERAFNIICAV